MKTEYSCYNCPNRTEACHDTCETYKKWLDEYREQEKQKQARRKEYRDLFYERSKGC